MKKKYESERDVFAVVKLFEDGTISRDDWKHAEHLTVALCYLSEHNFETATAKMRSGIFNLLRSFGVDLSREMPYHETLTIFWMRTIADFNLVKAGTSLLDRANEVVEKFDKDYPMRFYSRDRLFSDEARAQYLEPDAEAVQILFDSECRK